MISIKNQVEGCEFPENEQGKMETFEVLYSWRQYVSKCNKKWDKSFEQYMGKPL